MSLWLALIWLVCAVICAGVFLFCRKRLADISHRVSCEFDNRVAKILEAERNAEDRLLEAFVNFADSSEAIRAYQASEAEAFRSPTAKPAWNWSDEDLNLWRKQAEGQERAGRGRPVIMAIVVIILALNTGAAVTSVVTLNSVKPIMMTGSSGFNASGQLPQAVGLPPVPTANSLGSAKVDFDSVADPSPNIYQTVDDKQTDGLQ